ncbi:SulP family inorganic anion transporter [Methylomicrobium sp. Wu6]|uniref:SulP family inorganic anion transporter n=1 Tax=Methylomicrobium sp. Wu6 TaxID=3107928 RepID=UPI002DD6579F|nr:SulP family inorganic anion transporter [Methylomicrobium sp. Wu6]MEC4748657.1 SulP family inorganic anion transporter [Methylomicrobium sp. Wu6]
MTMQSGMPHETGLDALKTNWRSDLFAGFFVFLIALPLCLGIAVASGFPPSAGIITAIVGGLLVSRVNGSYVTINGPAAGLIVVILGAVQTLGDGDVLAGYRYTLAAIMLAGALQVLMGVYKAGQYSAYFPPAVVHGMLAGLGIIIIAKQSHVMLGASPEPGSIFATIAQIPHSLLNPDPVIAFIGLSGLAVLIFWPRLKHPKLKAIPAPLVVLLTGMGLGQIFGVQHEHWHPFLSDAEIQADHAHAIAPRFLVDIPDEWSSFFQFADYSKALTLEFWSAVLSICLVGSLETLLSATAVDKLDPYKRKSDLDRDLAAVGLGNTVAGFIGGLPMIAEIVRSSSNIQYGAKTGWANFFHGLILLAFVALFPHLIHNIPLASLAALLVYTGFKLASPKTFSQVWAIGAEQLGLFVITMLGVLATDLLIGVLLGIAVKLGIHIARGVWLENMLKIHFSIEQTRPDTIVVKLSGSALFSNYLPLKQALEVLEKGKTIIFDFSNGYLIDHTVMDFIHDFSNDYAAQGGICHQVGHALEKFSDHALAARLMTEDDRKK